MKTLGIILETLSSKMKEYIKIQTYKQNFFGGKQPTLMIKLPFLYLYKLIKNYQESIVSERFFGFYGCVDWTKIYVQ